MSGNGVQIGMLLTIMQAVLLKIHKATPSGSVRVYRGGGWNGNASYLRVAFRSNNFPGYRNGYVGFVLLGRLS